MDTASIPLGLLSHLLAAHATNSVSVQLGGPELRYFLDHHEAGLIGYRTCAGVAVALGDPLCAPRDTRELLARFLETRTRRTSRAMFVSASEAFAREAATLDCGAIKIGEEGLFDLDCYSFSGGAMKRLRYHESRARRRGVDVITLAATDLPSHWLAPALAAAATAWLERKALGPLGFLLALRPLREPEKTGKRLFVATGEGRVLAFLTAVPIPAANGVYLEDYIRAPDTPDGTVEMLFHAACEELRARGYDYVTLGASPLARLQPGDHRDHPAIGWLLRTAFERVSWPYDFKSLFAFKARFHPTRWVAKYLVYERPFTPRLAAALALAYLPDGGAFDTLRRTRPSSIPFGGEARGERGAGK